MSERTTDEIYAEMRKTCKHNDDGNLFYYPAINEEGWRCFCQTKLGFRPDLDRRLIRTKVSGLLMDLHEHKLLYVSNGSMGDAITENVASECEKRTCYDQQTILALLIGDPNVGGHAEYWRKESEKWIAERLLNGGTHAPAQ